MIKIPHFKKKKRFHTSTAGGMSSIPGWGKKIPHATWHGDKKKKSFPKLKKKVNIWGVRGKGSIGKATAIQMPVP